jgi:hypothetical protein
MARAPRFMTEKIRSKALESEEMLLLAVFEQAIADLDDPCPAVRAEASAYVFSYDSDYSIFSFDSVCSYFKLSTTAVRQVLQARVRDRRTTTRSYETAA